MKGGVDEQGGTENGSTGKMKKILRGGGCRRDGGRIGPSGGVRPMRGVFYIRNFPFRFHRVY
ncbi:hypothetical protein DESC_600053 [Desulfosarcina cetonica]|nr:hypothetical protein DESC_600053 [Desulfosarcina cetonica]